MYTKVLSVIANFHSPFHKTTKQTLSHLTYSTPTNCGLCFASSLCCVSKINVGVGALHVFHTTEL